MEELFGGLFGAGVGLVVIVIAGAWLLPFILSIVICQRKGQLGCLGFALAFFLSWIGVLIALCLTNVKQREEQHREMLVAITSQNRSQPIVINSPQTSQMSSASPSPGVDFRMQAIRNLKAIGKPFDEFDLDLETDTIRKAYEESRSKEIAEQEQKQREEKVRMEEEARNRQEIENKKRNQVLTRVAIVVGAVLLLGALSFTVIYLLKNGRSAQEMALTAGDSSRPEKIEDILSQLIMEWNDAHSLNSTGRLTDLYHSEALFYGQQLKRDKIYSKKLSALQKAKGFEQKIVGDINIKYVNASEYRCDFVKQVTINKKTNNYPSYLIFRKFDNQWKIVVESDETTDKNLAKRTADAAKKVNWRFDYSITGYFNQDSKLDTASLYFQEIENGDEYDGNCAWIVPAGFTNGDFVQVLEECSYCRIHFSDPIIPTINVIGISGELTNLGDLNEDGKDELGFSPQWFQSRFGYYQVWTLSNNLWIAAVEPIYVTEFTTDDEEEMEWPPIKRHPTKKGYVYVYEYTEFEDLEGNWMEEVIQKTVKIS
jgi:hypothetical protein